MKSMSKRALLLCVISVLCVQFSVLGKRGQSKQPFGGFSISKKLFDFIRENLDEGRVILEFGSGWGSGQLSNHYTVYSIEHDQKWIDKYDTHYIYAPIKNGWYDVAVLEKELPLNYDLILVDGPPGHIGRGGFYTYLALFNTDVPIIFDDTHRKADYNLMVNVAKKLGRKFRVFKEKEKSFGVLL